MIAKLIRMNRRSRRASTGLARRRNLQRLRQAVFALTRYIVDADPYSLIEAAERDILSITDYALATEDAGIEPGEKVEAFGCRNLISDDLAAWQAQMLAVAARAPKVRSPVLHIILSLREEEEWNAVEREEAIDVVLATLGLQRCPVVWAEHRNTANPHLHLSIVRVDPRTGRAAGSGWLIDDLHQAIALIEERQGRSREPGALYVARGGAVFDSESGAMVRDVDGRYIADWYKALGTKHNRLPHELRQLRAELVNAAGDAKSWADLHEEFSNLSVHYDRSGSGARVAHGSKSVKASEIHRSLARGNLEKRLGAFEPDVHRLDAGYEGFRHALDVQLKELRARRDQECARLDAWANATVSSLSEPARAAYRKAVQTEARDARKALQQAFAEAIKQCTGQRLTLERWQGRARPAYRRVSTPAVILPQEVNGGEHPSPPNRRFPRRNSEWATDYLDENENRLFTDHRIVIIVHRIDHPAAIDEALRLGAARWGTVSVRGPEAFLELAASRGAALGISVVGPNGALLRVVEKPPPQIVPPVAPLKQRGGAPLGREDSVTRAIRILSEHPSPPLRRREQPGDQGPRTGPLELVVQKTSLDSVEHGTVFDLDPRFQAFLEGRRADTLNQVRRLLLGAGLERCPSNGGETLKALDCDEKLERSVAAMAHDQDFLEMLRGVREKMRQRRPVRYRDNDLTLERDDGAVAKVPDEDTNEQDGYSVAEQQAFQNRGGKAR